MSIFDIPAKDAQRLIPLLHQVHNLHVLHQPARYRALPDDESLADWLSDWLAAPGLTALGYARDKDLVGYLIYEVEKRQPTPFRASETRFMLHHICVDAMHRRKGIAKMLIAELDARARAEKADVLGVTYATFNITSAALMVQAGFSPAYIYAEHRLDVGSAKVHSVTCN
ncbi:MAG: GNAT family N-acetyltransferase [Pseudomonadota bacterium]